MENIKEHLMVKCLSHVCEAAPKEIEVETLVLNERTVMNVRM